MRIERMSLASVSALSGVTISTLSLALRGYMDLPESVRDLISLTVTAMCLIADESAAPIDWRQAMRLKSVVDAKVVELRRARSTELRRQFETGSATA
jgi:hypothetical protein